MASESTPTLARKALGEALERHREAAGLERGEVAAEVDVHPDTVRRWEIGEIGPSTSRVRDVARICNIAPAEVSRLCTLVKASKERGLMERHPGGAPPEFRVFADVEIRADRIWNYQAEYIPGLVQTPEYLRALQDAQLPLPEGAAKAVQSLRIRRQNNTFSRNPMPEIKLVMGVGTMIHLDTLPDVRDGQIQRLRKAAALPTVDIRVITGLHPAMSGGFTILTPAPSTPGANPFTYLEAQDLGRYVEAPEVVSLYERMFQATFDKAQPLEEYLT